MLKCRSPMDSMRAAYRAGRERFADLFVIPVPLTIDIQLDIEVLCS
jgi:hypothetical protein